MAEQNNGAAGAEQAQFTIQKIYVRDVSFEVPGAPQIFNEPGQPQLELTEPGRRPDGVVPAGGDGAQGDDLADTRPGERVGDRAAHPGAGGRELRVGDHVGEQHQGRLDVLEEHAQVPRVGQVAGHDLGPPRPQRVQLAPVLQDPHRLTLA